MGNKFVQQVKVVTGQEAVREHVSLSEMSFFDEAGDPLVVGVSPAAHVAPVTTANATDLPTAQALANANKVAINAVIAALIAADLMAAS
jgi:hypothetical protein